MFYNMKVITKTSTEVKQKDKKDTSFLDKVFKIVQICHCSVMTKEKGNIRRGLCFPSPSHQGKA